MSESKAAELERSAELRLRGIGWMPQQVRSHFVSMLGEFVGTFLFLFFAFSGTQVANEASAARVTVAGQEKAPDAETLLYIALSFGFSLAVNAWVFFRISGGLFNPAVTLALFFVGAVGFVRCIIIFIAQLLGAIAAAAVVYKLFPGQLNVRTTLGGDTSVVRGLFIEMFSTALLIFTILMLAAEKHKGTYLAPVGIGLSLFIAEMSSVYFTGGSLNPARTLGPDVVLHTFNSYHWIYWVGPILGTVVAVGFYRLIKILEYETANPGQDAAKEEDVPSSPSSPSHEHDLEAGPAGGQIVQPRIQSQSNYTTDSFRTNTSTPIPQVELVDLHPGIHGAGSIFGRIPEDGRIRGPPRLTTRKSSKTRKLETQTPDTIYEDASKPERRPV